jgi:SRSO17 transposase
VKTQNQLAVAAAIRVDVDLWRVELDTVMTRIGPRFLRSEPRARVGQFVQVMLAGLSRTTCWSIAEHAGESDPRGMQRLLSEAVWDTDAVRDDLRSYVLEHLAAVGAVLVVDLCRGRDYAEVLRRCAG